MWASIPTVRGAECDVPEPPLCKGRRSRKARQEGLYRGGAKLRGAQLNSPSASGIENTDELRGALQIENNGNSHCLKSHAGEAWLLC